MKNGKPSHHFGAVAFRFFSQSSAAGLFLRAGSGILFLPIGSYRKESDNMRKSKKGFTLAELLIVVAIIAVLAAVSVPLFSRQLEKSREATDAANIRSGYSELMAAVISNDLRSSL